MQLITIGTLCIPYFGSQFEREFSVKKGQYGDIIRKYCCKVTQ